ncbi:hypothetical protein PsorP6_005495 [Peronosclerospora sorghi]|uniref:Uncharacterized protein n=1 Tax=Peronosclerospora sorghi TaxID=230839 RepID=A0ACC0W0U6_9STRA|nr:hypothetical protein PsorP6_005495 [Peronosclerospora sorghi]
MMCSIQAATDVHDAEVVLHAAATQQEPKELRDMPVVAMHDSGLAERNQRSEQLVETKNVWLLVSCSLGILVSFTLNGLVLEKITTHRVLGELSMTFVLCVFNACVASGLRRARHEKTATMPQHCLVGLGLLAFGSSIASMVSLRYLTYITRILGKACKSIPVMIMGVIFGKKYAVPKYVSVLVLSLGVALFLVGTAHEKQAHEMGTTGTHASGPEHARTPNMVCGFWLLMLSLLLDGATGALEDKFMETYHIGPFDLMHFVNVYKALFAGVGMVVNSEVPTFLEWVLPSLPNLLLLSLTGAFGQAFIFFTISKFGALTAAIIGTCRKVLSIVLSVVWFGHVLSLQQTVGLSLSFVGIAIPWIKLTTCRAHPSRVSTITIESLEMDDVSKESLLESSSDDTVDAESDEHEDGEMSLETARKLELVNAWHSRHAPKAQASSATNARDLDQAVEMI